MRNEHLKQTNVWVFTRMVEQKCAIFGPTRMAEQLSNYRFREAPVESVRTNVQLGLEVDSGIVRLVAF